jgi:hypothetical protein
MNGSSDAAVLIKRKDCSVLDEGRSDKIWYVAAHVRERYETKI